MSTDVNKQYVANDVVEAAASGDSTQRQVTAVDIIVKSEPKQSGNQPALNAAKFSMLLQMKKESNMETTAGGASSSPVLPAGAAAVAAQFAQASASVPSNESKPLPIITLTPPNDSRAVVIEETSPKPLSNIKMFLKNKMTHSPRNEGIAVNQCKRETTAVTPSSTGTAIRLPFKPPATKSKIMDQQKKSENTTTWGKLPMKPAEPDYGKLPVRKPEDTKKLSPAILSKLLVKKPTSSMGKLSVAPVTVPETYDKLPVKPVTVPETYGKLPVRKPEDTKKLSSAILSKLLVKQPAPPPLKLPMRPPGMEAKPKKKSLPSSALGKLPVKKPTTTIKTTTALLPVKKPTQESVNYRNVQQPSGAANFHVTGSSTELPVNFVIKMEPDTSTAYNSGSRIIVNSSTTTSGTDQLLYSNCKIKNEVERYQDDNYLAETRNVITTTSPDFDIKKHVRLHVLNRAIRKSGSSNLESHRHTKSPVYVSQESESPKGSEESVNAYQGTPTQSPHLQVESGTVLPTQINSMSQTTVYDAPYDNYTNIIGLNAPSQMIVGKQQLPSFKTLIPTSNFSNSSAMYTTTSSYDSSIGLESSTPACSRISGIQGSANTSRVIPHSKNAINLKALSDNNMQPVQNSTGIVRMCGISSSLPGTNFPPQPNQPSIVTVQGKPQQIIYIKRNTSANPAGASAPQIALLSHTSPTLKNSTVTSGSSSSTLTSSSSDTIILNSTAKIMNFQQEISSSTQTLRLPIVSPSVTRTVTNTLPTVTMTQNAASLSATSSSLNSSESINSIDSQIANATQTCKSPSSTSSSLLCSPKNIVVNPSSNQDYMSRSKRKTENTAVEIIDSPLIESDLSAVDFIATLAAQNPVTEESSLELSPEELNLNAAFTMKITPNRMSANDSAGIKPSHKMETIGSNFFNSGAIPFILLPNGEVRSGNFMKMNSKESTQLSPIESASNVQNTSNKINTERSIKIEYDILCEGELTTTHEDVEDPRTKEAPNFEYANVAAEEKTFKLPLRKGRKPKVNLVQRKPAAKKTENRQSGSKEVIESSASTLSRKSLEYEKASEKIADNTMSSIETETPPTLLQSKLQEEPPSYGPAVNPFKSNTDNDKIIREDRPGDVGITDLLNKINAQQILQKTEEQRMQEEKKAQAQNMKEATLKGADTIEERESKKKSQKCEMQEKKEKSTEKQMEDLTKKQELRRKSLEKQKVEQNLEKNQITNKEEANEDEEKNEKTVTTIAKDENGNLDNHEEKTTDEKNKENRKVDHSLSPADVQIPNIDQTDTPASLCDAVEAKQPTPVRALKSKYSRKVVPVVVKKALTAQKPKKSNTPVAVQAMKSTTSELNSTLKNNDMQNEFTSSATKTQELVSNMSKPLVTSTEKSKDNITTSTIQHFTEESSVAVRPKILHESQTSEKDSLDATLLNDTASMPTLEVPGISEKSEISDDKLSSVEQSPLNVTKVNDFNEPIFDTPSTSKKSEISDEKLRTAEQKPISDYNNPIFEGPSTSKHLRKSHTSISTSNDETAEEDLWPTSSSSYANRKRLRKTITVSNKNTELETTQSDSDDGQEFYGFNDVPTFADLRRRSAEYTRLLQDQNIEPKLKKVKLAISESSSVSRSMPLKKRWEQLTQKSNEETDITDDTSPRDDDDDDDDDYYETSYNNSNLEIDKSGKENSTCTTNIKDVDEESNREKDFNDLKNDRTKERDKNNKINKNGTILNPGHDNENEKTQVDKCEAHKKNAVESGHDENVTKESLSEHAHIEEINKNESLKTLVKENEIKGSENKKGVIDRNEVDKNISIEVVASNPVGEQSVRLKLKETEIAKKPIGKKPKVGTFEIDKTVISEDNIVKNVCIEESPQQRLPVTSQLATASEDITRLKAEQSVNTKQAPAASRRSKRNLSGAAKPTITANSTLTFSENKSAGLQTQSSATTNSKKPSEEEFISPKQLLKITQTETEIMEKTVNVEIDRSMSIDINEAEQTAAIETLASTSLVAQTLNNPALKNTVKTAQSNIENIEKPVDKTKTINGNSVNDEIASSAKDKNVSTHIINENTTLIMPEDSIRTPETADAAATSSANIIPTKVPKKRGRKPKLKPDSTECISNETPPVQLVFVINELDDATDTTDTSIRVSEPTSLTPEQWINQEKRKGVQQLLAKKKIKREEIGEYRLQEAVSNTREVNQNATNEISTLLEAENEASTLLSTPTSSIYAENIHLETTQAKTAKNRGRKSTAKPNTTTECISNAASALPMENPTHEENEGNVQSLGKRSRKRPVKYRDSSSEEEVPIRVVINSEKDVSVVHVPATRKHSKQKKLAQLEPNRNESQTTSKKIQHNEAVVAKIRVRSTKELLNPPAEEDPTKKRSYKKKKKTSENVETQIENVQAAKKEFIPSFCHMKQSGHTKKMSGPDFNTRLLLIRNRAQLNTDEVLTVSEENAGKGPVQCGLCLDRTTVQGWNNHISEHYGVGWQFGNEESTTLLRGEVLAAIMRFFQNTDIKTLACRMCGRNYRSALGLLVHVERCGTDEAEKKTACEYCKKAYSKLTIQQHILACPKRLNMNLAKKSELEEQLASTVEIVYSDAGRLKRRSLVKAENKLKELTHDFSETSELLKAKKTLRYQPPPSSEDRTKWENDLQDFGKVCCTHKMCNYVAGTVEEVEEHITDCKYAAPGYHCVRCKKILQVFSTLEEAESHFNQTHNKKRDDCFSLDASIPLSESENESSGVDSNIESEGETPKKRDRRKKPKFFQNCALGQNRVYPLRSHDADQYLPSRWSEFIDDQYSVLTLFSAALPKFEFCTDIKMPCENISMRFAFSNEVKVNKFIEEEGKQLDWKQLERFQTTTTTKNDLLMFLGAPIRMISWVPLPPHIEEQYLCVLYRKHVNSFTRYHDPIQYTTFIYILKITQGAGSSTSSSSAISAQVHYALRVPNAPVHCVSFLPSGGYDAEMNRLGLVAVGGVGSDIHIYSLPLDVGIHQEGQEFAMIDLKPAFKLGLDLTDSHDVITNTICLTICWSEAALHQHIFAGYANGFIAYWDISDDDENLTRVTDTDDNVMTFTPLNCIYFGEKCVISIGVHYDSNGPRWIGAANFVRKFVLYDIRDMANPIKIREGHGKGIIRDFHWCPMWESHLTAYCDLTPFYGRCIGTTSPYGVSYLNRTLGTIPSAVTQVHYSPWLNIVVGGSESGEVVFYHMREMNLDDFHYTTDKAECTVAALTDVVCFNGDKIPIQFDSEKEEQWSQFKDNIGVVFSNPMKVTKEFRKIFENSQRKPPLNIERYLTVNSLRCNLNKGGCNLIAMGNEAGFVKIFNFKTAHYFKKETK